MTFEARFIRGDGCAPCGQARRDACKVGEIMDTAARTAMLAAFKEGGAIQPTLFSMPNGTTPGENTTGNLVTLAEELAGGLGPAVSKECPRFVAPEAEAEAAA